MIYQNCNHDTPYFIQGVMKAGYDRKTEDLPSKSLQVLVQMHLCHLDYSHSMVAGGFELMS